MSRGSPRSRRSSPGAPRTGAQWCEPGGLRRLRQRAIAALRDGIAPVEKEGFARFLLDWHGIGTRRGGPARLAEVIAQLEGIPLSHKVLVERILPARIPD